VLCIVEMGLTAVSLDSAILSFQHIQDRRRMLTLGRQQIYMLPHIFTLILNHYGLPSQNTYNLYDYCEKFFIDMGFGSVDSMDNSAYEKASILHNLNFSVPSELKGKYNYIFDGGTSEHIFNVPQVYENIIDLLAVGGVVCTVIPNNNFSGHGMYQFSPEFFLSIFTPKYGMELLNLYLGKDGVSREFWIDVNDFKKGQGNRNTSKFNDTDEVYIISVARKITDVRSSLIKDPPNQYSYEESDWKKAT